MAPSGDADVFVDYYLLLSISASATDSEIRRAYRKTSLLYHPDKVKKPTPETAHKFQQLQTAINVLGDADEKTKYDQVREAKLRRVMENEALEGRRRKMKEELEHGEMGTGVVSGVGLKRSWSEREVKMKGIAEENRRKREAIVLEKARAAKEARQKEEKKDTDAEEPVDSMARSVKVRWRKEGDGLDVDDEWLTKRCEAFGEVENVLLLKDRKKKADGRDRRVIVGSALVVFGKLAAAEKAVASSGVMEGVESITWAAEKETEPS